MWTIGAALLVTTLHAAGAPEQQTMTRITPLPEDVRAEMIGVSWHEGCPVALDDLRLLKPRFVGLDGKPHIGELVVHHSAAEDVAAIFEELFAAGFRIERMQRIDAYGGDDDKSMAANNTSAFNCRPVAGRSKGFSRHAYGVAIDVNPRTNPFVRPGKGPGGGDRIDPPGGEAYLDRTQEVPGLIVKGDVVTKAFIRRGFAWGGNWRTMKDYQHFQRPLPKPADEP
jgi:hypothetical protein